MSTMRNLADDCVAALLKAFPIEDVWLLEAKAAKECALQSPINLFLIVPDVSEAHAIESAALEMVRMDLSDVVARQHIVTQADLKSIARTYWFNIFTFSDALGPQFTAENYPRTAALFARVIVTADFVTSALKSHYQRPGPFVAHPDQVQLLVRNEPGYSYPSGHTTRGRLCALVLAELDPSQRGLIVPAAERVGSDRIMAGEHYQTDIAASRRLAKILFQILSKNRQFQAELATVKAAEWTTPPQPAPDAEDR